jgi:hypothetical protein
MTPISVDDAPSCCARTMSTSASALCAKFVAADSKIEVRRNGSFTSQRTPSVIWTQRPLTLRSRTS